MSNKQQRMALVSLACGLVAWNVSGAWLPQAQAQTCTATVAQTEGPYYQFGSPETNNLVIPGDGPLLTFNGQVVDANCNPIPYTWLDIWHANAVGQYDNTPPYNQYRGHFFTDATGHFTLTTIRPGLYPGRTRHIHFKADAANTSLLTSQLYFPNEPQNATDMLYNASLQMNVTLQGDGSYLATYTIKLPVTGGCVAPAITGNPGNTTIAAGGTATFSIMSTGSTPMTFSWQKDGSPLSNGPRISGATTSTLTITNVMASDAGSYTASALSSCGTATSAAAMLSVTGVPVTIASANPPASNPYGSGRFRDVLENTDTALNPQGIGAAGTPAEGPYSYATITLTFSGTPSPLPAVGNIGLSCTGGACPTVTSVSGSGSGPYAITLSGVIPALNCTTLTFAGTSAGQSLQYQALPGDTNLDGTVNTVDLLQVVTSLNNGTAADAANSARYNIDRIGGVNTQDLLRLTQLLNGTNATQAFNGASVVACP